MLQKLCEAATLTILFKDVHFFPVHLNAIIFDNVRMSEHFHDIHFVVDLLK